MALIPYEPFKNIERFFEDDDEWFLPVTRKDNAPEMDVYETESDIIAEVSIPGMDKDDLSVSIDEGVLCVRGDKKEEKEEEVEEKGYYRKEIRKGSFERMVRLPSNIDTESVKANYENGILKVEIPKVDEVERGKEIEIE